MKHRLLTLFGRATAWSPATLGAGVKAWYTAGPSWCFTDAGVTPAAHNDPIQQWNDRSGTALNFTQSTLANRPKLILSSGRYYVRFDGSNDTMVTAATALSTLWGATSGYVTGVVMRTTAARSDPLLAHGSAGANAVRVWSTFSDNSLYYDHGDSSAGSGRISGAKPASYENVYHVEEFFRSGANQQIIVDTTTVATSSTMTDSLDSLASTAAVSIGNHLVDAGANFFLGDMAELVFVPGISAADRLLLRAYLKAQWGTP